MRREYLYVISGILMVMLSVLFLRYYRIDPNDWGLIINEQAINLTSQFADEVRECVTIEEFVNEVRSNERNRNLYTSNSHVRGGGGKSMKDLSMEIKEKQLQEIEEKHIIKRWQSPSIIEAL
jgi:hypothetical protein